MSAVQNVKPIPDGMPTLVPHLATHVRDVSADEMRAATAAMSGGQ